MPAALTGTGEKEDIVDSTKGYKRLLSHILVTGGCGFIGSHFIDYVLNALSRCVVVNMDAMTYAANEENTRAAAVYAKDGRYFFEKADVTDGVQCRRIMKQYDIDTIVHFAAESHVDRSIAWPEVFVRTNVLGTQTLLEAARSYWTQQDGTIREGVLFHHVSTDEVYGAQRSTAEAERAREDSALFPTSPYAASKAASDLIALAWNKTYRIPVTLSRCSNNYGARQYPEKFLPLMIQHIKEGKRLPVYGTGTARRNWIHVEDHVRAILLIMQCGTPFCACGIYNIAGGSGSTISNIDLLHRVIGIESSLLCLDKGKVQETIGHVDDRLAHDALYSMNCSKMMSLGWKPSIHLDEGLTDTIKWYTRTED